jgi:8-oxo-dGTP diphosphatase
VKCPLVTGGANHEHDKILYFPHVTWQKDTVTFVVVDSFTNVAPTPAALVFPFYGSHVVLANITGRGWCIPGGHVEQGETLVETIHRESYEEAGIELDTVCPLGYFALTATETQKTRYIPTFIARVSNFGEIPASSESEGRHLATLEDVADCYFAWDELLSAVFAYAWNEKEQPLRAGIPLADILG